MGKVDLTRIYTAKDMSIRIGKNRNYLSQAFRHNKFKILKEFNYQKVGGTLIFSDDPQNDLSELVTAKQASRLLGKHNEYFAHIAKRFPERLRGIDYTYVGTTLILTKEALQKFQTEQVK